MSIKAFIVPCLQGTFVVNPVVTDFVQDASQFMYLFRLETKKI